MKLSNPSDFLNKENDVWNIFNGLRITCLKEFVSKPVPTSGRITIRGLNGVGKSTFLCWFKERVGESAFYLPAQHDLIFESTKEKNLSTGQSLKVILEEISAKAASEITLLMLDEWDANLDQQSRQIFHELIDKMSYSILIIEVRHNNMINALNNKNPI